MSTIEITRRLATIKPIAVRTQALAFARHNYGAGDICKLCGVTRKQANACVAAAKPN